MINNINYIFLRAAISDCRLLHFYFAQETLSSVACHAYFKHRSVVLRQSLKLQNFADFMRPLKQHTKDIRYSKTDIIFFLMSYEANELTDRLMVSDHRRPWTPATSEESQVRCRPLRGLGLR